MKKKYYSVKSGRIPGVYQTWDEAKKQVDGYPGAKYKSFSTLIEAENFIKESLDDSVTEQKSEDYIDMNKLIEANISSLEENECLAAVDGSYDPASEKLGFGVIIISYGHNKDILYKAFDKNLGAEFLTNRNVAAELEGVKEAINWAIDSKKNKITIYYDYEGIEKWATGEWKAKKGLTKKYVEFIHDKIKIIDVKFVKVPAHSGVELNEEVDALAKYSLLSKGHKTYNDGSVYFVGYNATNWESFVDDLNKETLTFDENRAQKINLSVQSIGQRQKIVITHLNDKVVINCYPHNKSYVQGKKSVLFQKVIAAGIERLSTKQSVVETLNCYHALNITQEDVEIHFERLIPNFKGNYGDKIYFNLLSAVYNTMLTGYMPDYTCLITPIFRAYEYCLHKVLGEKMGLTTAKDNGTNNFSYFNKDSSGTYKCNNPKINCLNEAQINYLNDLYTSYNAVRHPYSHWSSDDYDTAVIPEIQTARDFLTKGLTLIDDYYRTF